MDALGPEGGRAAALGIYTDTSALLHGATALDFRMFEKLTRDEATVDVLDELRDYRVPPEWFDYRSEAFLNAEVTGTVRVAPIGYVKEGFRDVIAEVASDLLRIEGLHRHRGGGDGDGHGGAGARRQPAAAAAGRAHRARDRRLLETRSRRLRLPGRSPPALPRGGRRQRAPIPPGADWLGSVKIDYAGAFSAGHAGTAARSPAASSPPGRPEVRPEEIQLL
jgi:hypothetical protein